MQSLRQTFLLFLSFLFLFSAQINAAPLVARQITGSTSVTTNTSTDTAAGRLTQTCEIILTPKKNDAGEDVVEKVTKCTSQVVPVGEQGTTTSSSSTATLTATGTSSSPTSTATTSSAATSTATATGQSTSTSASSTATATGSGSTLVLTASSTSATAATTESSSTGSTSGAASSAASPTPIVLTTSAAPASSSSTTPSPAAASGTAATDRAPSTTSSSSSATATPTPIPSPPADQQATTAAEQPTQTLPASSTAAVDPNGTAVEQVSPTSTEFTLPGKKLSVLPIGLGVFAGISVIALIVVGLVTYERTKYRKKFRERKLAESGAAMGYGGSYDNV